MIFSKKHSYLNSVLLFTALSVAFSIFVQYKRAELLDIAINKTGGFTVTAILFVAYILLEIISTHFMNDRSKKYAINQTRAIRQGTYSRYLQSQQSLDSTKKSALTNGLTQQVDLLKENYIMSGLLLIFLVSKSLVIIVLMLKVNILLTSLVVLMLLSQILLPKILGKTLNRYNTQYIQKLESFTRAIDEFMGIYKSIFVFSAQKFFKKRLDDSLEGLCTKEYKNFFFNNLLRSINMLVSYSTHFLAIILCTYFIYRDTLNIKNAYLLIGFVE